MNLRYLWRSVSLVFVLLFALFPTLSYASETVTNQTYTYDWREAERELLEYSSSFGDSRPYSFGQIEIQGGYLSTQIGTRIKVNGSNVQSKTLVSETDYLPPFTFESDRSVSASDYTFWATDKELYQYYVTFTSKSNSSIMDKGGYFNIDLNGLFFALHNQYSWSITNLGGGGGYLASVFDSQKILKVVLTLYSNSDRSGTYKEYTITDALTRDGDTFGISAKEIEAPFDVKAFRIWFSFEPDSISFDTSSVEGFNGWTSQAKLDARYIDSTLLIKEVDQNTGLLSGIIEWLKSIRDGILNVGNGVTNVFNSILELPSKIWTYIQEGLKMLFIPSESDITDMHSQWDELMRDRFGAIYEAGDLVHSFGQTVQTSAIMAVDSGGVIELPSATVNLAGVPFTFGGYTVDIIPAGFEFLSNAVKSIVNIICTVIFLNMLRNKLEELIR